MVKATEVFLIQMCLGDGSSAVWDSNRRDLGEDEQRKAEARARDAKLKFF